MTLADKIKDFFDSRILHPRNGIVVKVEPVSQYGLKEGEKSLKGPHKDDLGHYPMQITYRNRRGELLTGFSHRVITLVPAGRGDDNSDEKPTFAYKHARVYKTYNIGDSYP